MKKLTILFLFLFTIVGAKANDGVYYVDGNQLIPITETDISVKKEVLTINRVGDHLEVTVYYEFFNPSKPKDLLVGFEAAPPYDGSGEMTDGFPNHPNVRNFTVTLNGDRLDYEVAHVMYDESYKMKDYYKNGRFADLTFEQCTKAFNDYEGMSYPFYYVYHFKAKFREGLNIVQHTYDFDISSSVGEEYRFNYVLTAANRWANHQIDDFTLNIDMGELQSFFIDTSFYKNINEWTFKGAGRVTPPSEHHYQPMFHVQKGSISFHRDNFHPEGELYISKPFYAMNTLWSYDGLTAENVMKVVGEAMGNLDPLASYDVDVLLNDEQRRIMKNVPYAYRGHVFKDKGLKEFFESTDWYVPDPNYQDDQSSMSQEEKKWIRYWSK